MTAAVRREDLARALAGAVTAVPGVAELSPGTSVEVSTLFANGKVVGVRLGDDTVEIHVVADRLPLPPVANEVARAARRVLAAAGVDAAVHVVIEDVVTSALDRRARALGT